MVSNKQGKTRPITRGAVKLAAQQEVEKHRRQQAEKQFSSGQPRHINDILVNPVLGKIKIEEEHFIVKEDPETHINEVGIQLDIPKGTESTSDILSDLMVMVTELTKEISELREENRMLNKIQNEQELVLNDMRLRIEKLELYDCKGDFVIDLDNQEEKIDALDNVTNADNAVENEFSDILCESLLPTCLDSLPVLEVNNEMNADGIGLEATFESPDKSPVKDTDNIYTIDNCNTAVDFESLSELPVSEGTSTNHIFSSSNNSESEVVHTQFQTVDKEKDVAFSQNCSENIQLTRINRRTTRWQLGTERTTVCKTTSPPRNKVNVQKHPKFKRRIHVPVKCEICNKQLASSGNLTLHMLVHTGDMPFQCSVCNKKFRQKMHLVCHMRVHTGEMPFQCNICNKSYPSKSSLIYHLQTHQEGTKLKQFSCIFCDGQKARRSHLYPHIQAHIKEKPYSCGICRKSYCSLISLKNHMKCKH